MQNIKQQLLIDIASFDPKRKKTSKLSPYKDQILVLSQYMSYYELAEWLSSDKGVSITPPAIHYMIKKWKTTNMKTLAQITDALLSTESESKSESIKQKRRYSSKLELYRLEIMTLYDELNQSGATIQLWLKQKKNIHVTRDTVYKRITYWRNLNESKNQKQATEKVNPTSRETF